MKNYLFILAAVLIFGCKTQTEEKLVYPQTQQREQTDDYFGTKVSDPYRWMEEEGSDDVNKWVQTQHDFTEEYLAKLPMGSSLKDRLTALWDFEREGAPFKKGNNYFYLRNSGLQNQSVLFIADSDLKNERVLLDPNKFSEDGTVSLNNYAVSKNGKYFAYSTSSSGSDWNEIRVIDIESGQQLNDHLKWIKFSGISWKGDGFYYSRYASPDERKAYSSANEFHKVYYHKLGDAQEKDMLVHENRERPKRNFYVSTTEDESYLVLYSSEGAGGNNALAVKDLTKQGPGKLVHIVPEFKNQYRVIDNVGKELLVMTNKDAARKKVVLVNPEKPESEWRTILPESEDVLEAADIFGNKLVTLWMKDASNRIRIYDLQGNFQMELPLPGLGKVMAITGKKDEPVIYYSFTSYTYPSSVYRYNLETGETAMHFQPKIDFNLDGYETKQVFYNSKDGKRIPMFITHKKGLKLDGNNPTLLYGYGGFNISIKPDFSVSNLAFLENGGVYAVANLRGGSEYGEEWHQEGMLLNKQNVFNDFIAAAEYLINQKYTSSKKLAIYGRSNGGLLVGAAMTQRPELFRVALPAVGVMDMLRYHKFTIGWAWASEYGSSEDTAHFKNLYGYSPLHNIKEGVCYPATLVTTADHDDRVVLAHSFKYISRLQEAQSCSNPVLIRIDIKAGHGAGKPTSKIIEESADVWAFVFHHLGMDAKKKD